MLVNFSVVYYIILWNTLDVNLSNSKAYSSRMCFFVFRLGVPMLPNLADMVSSSVVGVINLYVVRLVILNLKVVCSLYSYSS